MASLQAAQMRAHQARRRGGPQTINTKANLQRSNVQRKPVAQTTVESVEVDSQASTSPVSNKQPTQLTAQDLERLLQQPGVVNILNKAFQQQQSNKLKQTNVEVQSVAGSSESGAQSPTSNAGQGFEMQRPGIYRVVTNGSASSSQPAGMEIREITPPASDAGSSSGGSSPKMKMREMQPIMEEAVQMPVQLAPSIPNHLELARNAREATVDEIAEPAPAPAPVMQAAPRQLTRQASSPELSREMTRLNEETSRLQAQLKALEQQFSSLQVEKREVHTIRAPAPVISAPAPVISAPAPVHISVPPVPAMPRQLASPITFMRPREAPQYRPNVSVQQVLPTPVEPKKEKGRKRKAVMRLFINSARADLDDMKWI